MTNSMTAFSRCESATDLGELSWELRTVNHRYLEMMFRVPEELRRFEPGFRRAISAKLKRGRVDAQFRYKADETIGEKVEVDHDTINRLGSLADEIEAAIPDIRGLRVIDVLSWPGVVKTPELSVDELGAAANQLLDRALAEVLTIRRQEGNVLNTLIQERITKAQAIVAELDPIAATLGDRYRERLRERLHALSTSVDAERLEQEVVIHLQKADVDEELDRLKMHLAEVGRVVDEDVANGRRLDFLMQELNREANTLGSKAVDNRVSRASVDLKVLIEQMREQIQNIE